MLTVPLQRAKCWGITSQLRCFSRFILLCVHPPSTGHYQNPESPRSNTRKLTNIWNTWTNLAFSLTVPRGKRIKTFFKWDSKCQRDIWNGEFIKTHSWPTADPQKSTVYRDVHIRWGEISPWVHDRSGKKVKFLYYVKREDGLDSDRWSELKVTQWPVYLLCVSGQVMDKATGREFDLFRALDNSNRHRNLPHRCAM